MINFADEALIEVRSGNGGNGCVAFRREKYIPHGGPNGGDGGKGGDVIFTVKRNMRTLSNIRHKHCFKAKNGGDGQGWNRFGADGEDCIIPVPPGTTIRDAETGEFIYDFTGKEENESFVFLKGGNGGWGNVHFKSSTNQAPKHANPGQKGETRFLKLELSIMADAGLVGFPNAGKSSLLTAFTNARPKIAPYPFTTIIPNLGVLRVDDENDIIIADIPGIIEGASEGLGLGDTFLKHITRTSCLIFMIDCSDDNYLTAYETLCNELSNYSDLLMEKPRIVLCNKVDIPGAHARAVEIADKIHQTEAETPVVPISVLTGNGMKDARNHIISLVDRLEKRTESKENKEEKAFGSSFMEARAGFEDDDENVQYPGSEN
ncbi:putative chitosanase [Treponema sp. JC4]|uniref:GTPase ObgE n=1 Tax=Treponema sp. JC4 TaxID=1124982 RepID=UPI00025B0E23|nr:GTPase ObgE [Treponema sp. JC4]EID84843.1 putative chitosanase [Treponema sp. JC4]